MDGELIGLPDTEGTLLDVNVKSIRFTTPGLARFINGLAPDAGLDLSGFGKGEHFTFAGRVKGLLNKFTANGTLRGAGGKVQANLSIRNVADVQKPIGLGGCIDIDQVNVGRIIGEKALTPETPTSTSSFRVSSILPRETTTPSTSSTLSSTQTSTP